MNNPCAEGLLMYYFSLPSKKKKLRVCTPSVPKCLPHTDSASAKATAKAMGNNHGVNNTNYQQNQAVHVYPMCIMYTRF